MSIKLRLFLIAVLQTLVLVSIIGMKQWTLNTGETIVLEIQPIDPRSLFCGDYVRLSYGISTLRLDKVMGDREFKRHNRIYVLLKEGNPYWEPVSVHHKRPEITPGQVAIRGEVVYTGESLWDPQSGKSENVRHLSVRYGIENYFVPEGEGRFLERPGRDEKISIRVAVDTFGHAGIKAVLVNGKERYHETLF